MAIPNDWSNAEIRLYEEATIDVPGLTDDRMAQALYDTALFNWDISPSDRHAVMEAFKTHLYDTYGVEWDNVFDWEGYRSAYDNA